MATYTDEMLVEHYHNGPCPRNKPGDRCVDRKLERVVSTRQMLEEINETRRAVGAPERDPEGHRGV